jgi:formamidopyrimidine-DNA glycosylase
MPELPEIASRARELHAALAGTTIASIEVLQPKCLNIPAEDFTHALTGATITRVTHHGKWIFTETDRGYLLLNLGMGGELLLVDPEHLPKNKRLIFHFTDGRSLSVNFWWFGYAHYAPLDSLAAHAPTAKLGPNANELDALALTTLIQGRRGALKTFILDQSNLAGIGNVCANEILWMAKLHPRRKLESLTPAEIERLSAAICAFIDDGIAKGGGYYEVNIWGQKGGFGPEGYQVGYREGQPCPNCATPIVKIKTGSTSSFICPVCQPLIVPE